MLMMSHDQPLGGPGSSSEMVADMFRQVNQLASRLLMCVCSSMHLSMIELADDVFIH